MFVDQLGNKLEFKDPPKRIISLVPSQTELLYHLGLDKEVVGITKFCIHPDEWFRSKERVGGPKKINIDKVRSLTPDLIIANKEENTKKDVEALREIAPVWLSDVFNLDDACEMISQVALICGKDKEGLQIKRQVKANFSKIKAIKNRPKVLYMIWKKPYMAVASHTFIHHVLTEHLGFDNVLKDKERYPRIELADFPDIDFVFLSTEPYPFQEKHIPEFRAYFPNAQIVIVDGEYFTWYGSRLINAPSYFNALIDKIEL